VSRSNRQLRVLPLALLALLALLAGVGPSATADDSPYLTVWVHYDYMVGPGYSDAPSPAAIQMVVDAFKAHGVTLHIDPKHTAIPAQSVIVPDWQSVYASTPGYDDPSCTGPDAVRFSALRAQYFQPKSNHPWHYAVFGDYVFGDPAHVLNCPVTYETGHQPPKPGMSGDSQLGFHDVYGGLGYSFVVALQGFRDAGIDLSTLDQPIRARIEAAVFMHELGHNLGLCHGGPPLDGCSDLQDFADGSDNYKPNYISVMNYAFNFGSRTRQHLVRPRSPAIASTTQTSSSQTWTRQTSTKRSGCKTQPTPQTSPRNTATLGCCQS